MSDLDVTSSADRQGSVPRPEDPGRSFPRNESAAVEEREGLPRGFRMRADPHYVDLVMSSASGQPVRMVPVDELEAADAAIDTEHVVRLSRSIRVHGIVHPLLVRRHGLRYIVIAGRQRLAAARLLGLAAVPCLVHQADEADAAALADADNLAAPRTEPDPMVDVIAGVRQALAHHLSGIRNAADMAAAAVPSMRRSSFDLIHAHGWRAARLVDLLDLLARAPVRSRRQQPLTSIVEKVIDGFRPEARLNGVTLRLDVADGASMRSFVEEEVACGLAGAMMAMLPLVEHADEAAVTVRVGAPAERSIAVDVVSQPGQLAGSTAARFFDSASGDRPGGWCAVAGALAARTCAERQGGGATFTPHADPFLRMTFAF